MSKKNYDAIQWAIRFRREMARHQVSRRDVMKLGAVGTSAALLGLDGPAANADDTPISPPTTPFIDEMPLPETLRAFNSPAEFVDEHNPSRVVPTDAVVERDHQYYTANNRRFAAKKFYYLPVDEKNDFKCHGQLPLQTVWGYEGYYPGPTIDARYGEPILVRIHNRLPTGPSNFGIPQVITHLHNFHSASESDGGPWGYYNSGYFRDHHYTMARAGFTSNDPSINPDGWGDPRESLGTLFYHSHRPDFTTQNVYKGQLGFCRVFDEVDAGNELLDDGKNLRLPSGKYDVPMAFADKVFDSDGIMFFDPFNFDGIISDKPTVNGVVQPFFNVDCRSYRFRTVNGGPSRIMRYYLYNTRTGWLRDPFQLIANDGNLLPFAVRRGSIIQSVAERMDFILDFRQLGQPGDEIIMYNRGEQRDGRKPTGKLLTPGIPLVKFKLGGYVTDNSRSVWNADGSARPLRALPPINMNEVVAQRTFKFNRGNGKWTINSEVFNPSISSTHARIRRNTAEIWTLENSSGGWVHPVHIHFEEHRILSRNGFAPPVWERGRKDVTLLGRGERVKIFMRFRDFPEPEFSPTNPTYKAESGRYVTHCHNTVHEDHAMMNRWDIVPENG